MPNLLALNTAIFGPDVPTADKLRAAKTAGFDAVELWRRDCETGTTLGAVNCLLNDMRLSAVTYGPLMDFDGIRDPRQREARIVEALAMLSEAHALGITALQVCFSTSPDADPGRTVADIRYLCGRAATYGMLVAAESLAWSTTVRSLGAAWEVVRQAGCDNLGLVVDSYHLFARGGRAAGLDMSQVDPGRVILVQLSDLRHELTPEQAADPKQVRHIARHYRQFAGDGCFPTGDLLAWLAAHHYTGPISQEIFSDTYAAMDPLDAARKAMASLSRCGLPIYQ